jgi:hypothetical protein
MKDVLGDAGRRNLGSEAPDVAEDEIGNGVR